MAKQKTNLFRSVTTEGAVRVAKASDTVLGPWTFVTLDNNDEVVEADASSAKIAMLYGEAYSGQTDCLIIADRNAIFKAYGDRAFADSDKGAQVDLVINSDIQMVDLDASSTDLLTVQADAEVANGYNEVWEQDNILVRITAGKHLLD